MPREIAIAPRVPLPDRIEPRITARSLLPAVRVYFFRAYNAEEDGFRKWLISTSNKDALTRNRLFDRLRGVDMLKAMAAENDDDIVISASEGAIYKCINQIMKEHGHGLKLRRERQRLLEAAE